MDKETKERIEAPYRFVEFPKVLYHPDGRTATVETSRQESELGAEWFPSPTESLKERARRDAADAKRVALAVGKEAAAKGRE